MELKGKRVLITGADGFIGSHLTEALLEQKAYVRALSCYNSFNFWGWLEEIAPAENLEVVSGDLRDSFFCEKLVDGVDIVFHLGALISIPYSYVAAESYLQTNILGTHNLLQAVRRQQLKAFIHISSSEVYGSAKYIPIDENHPLQPQSPYAASKVGADALAYSFFCSYDLPVIIARPFNNYGPRQSARAVIPTILVALAAGKRKIELGDLSPRRDFLFVRDNCRALLLLAQTSQAAGQTVNIGTGRSFSVAELLEMIKKVTGIDFETVKSSERVRPAKSEVKQLEADWQKLFQLTGWKPQTEIEDGLRICWKWFSDQKNLLRYKSGLYNF